MIQFQSAIALGLLVAGGAMAQEARTNFTYDNGQFFFMRTEGGAGRVVKGAPYSAQAVTTSTQTLPDGNHIQRNITASIVRDSEGRTRREQTVNTIGALSASGATAKSVMIHDPVAGTTAVLDANKHVAHVNHMEHNFTFTRSENGAVQGAHAEPRMRHDQDANLKTEDLGTQVMEGLSVQGKRVTHTIPAGQVGNERAISSVTETWYSQDLQAVVMSKTSDPRNGETSYKLTNINRAEPDAALFQVPADYTVTDNAKTGPGPHMMRRGGPAAAPKQ
jgi:hypothetical protein